MTIKIRKGSVRNPDHETSVEGARSVWPRAGSQKARLLAAYYYYMVEGLTDEEAATYAGLLKACYWKRCGELRQDGFIEESDKTRPGEAGVPRIVCYLTPKGRSAHLRNAA